jgi:hypothetical protein
LAVLAIALQIGMTIGGGAMFMCAFPVDLDARRGGGGLGPRPHWASG